MKLIGGLWTPGTGLVRVHGLAGSILPLIEDTLDECPLSLYLITTGEERSVPVHRIK